MKAYYLNEYLKTKGRVEKEEHRLQVAAGTVVFHRKSLGCIAIVSTRPDEKSPRHSCIIDNMTEAPFQTKLDEIVPGNHFMIDGSEWTLVLIDKDVYKFTTPEGTIPAQVKFKLILFNDLWKHNIVKI